MDRIKDPIININDTYFPYTRLSSQWKHILNNFLKKFKEDHFYLKACMRNEEVLTISKSTLLDFETLLKNINYGNMSLKTEVFITSYEYPANTEAMLLKILSDTFVEGKKVTALIIESKKAANFISSLVAKTIIGPHSFLIEELPTEQTLFERFHFEGYGLEPLNNLEFPLSVENINSIKKQAYGKA